MDWPVPGAFPDFKMEIVDLIAEGDKVVAHFNARAPTRASGKDDRRPGDVSKAWMRSTLSESNAASSLGRRKTPGSRRERKRAPGWSPLPAAEVGDPGPGVDDLGIPPLRMARRFRYVGLQQNEQSD